MHPLLTVSEAVSVLSALGYGLTERQVRYLDLPASLRMDGGNGGRLYDWQGVALLAVFAELAEKCRKWGLPAWTARAALRYREAGLRRVLTRRTPRYLIVDPATGTAALSENTDSGLQAIDVRALAARVQPAVLAYRAAQPDVWTGAAYVEAEAFA